MNTKTALRSNPATRFIPLFTLFGILWFSTQPVTTSAQLIPVSQWREVYAEVCNTSTGGYLNLNISSGLGLFNQTVDVAGDAEYPCGDINQNARATQLSWITPSSIFATGNQWETYGNGFSTFNATCDVAVACYYSLTGSVSNPEGFVELDGPTNVIGIVSNGVFAFSGVMTPGLYAISAGVTGQNFENGTFSFDLEFPPAPPPRISSVTVQGNDVLLQWAAPPGTNLVQASNGAANGGYSNNFVTISPPIIIPGINLPVATNYLDAGGATNFPARYYRIASSTPPVPKPTLAGDNAADPGYTNGWTTGSFGGSGFSVWTLTASGVIGSGSNGFFIGSSANNAFQTSPGIDTNGVSWGLYANNNNFTAAYRQFATSLPVGGAFQVAMDTGFIDPGNADGFVLRNSNANGSYTNFNTGARFEFLFLGGQNSYAVVDASGYNPVGVPFTGTGLQLVFTLGTNDTYNLAVIDNATGNTDTNITGTLSGTPGSTIDSIALYNRNAGSGSLNDAFFNSLQIIGP